MTAQGLKAASLCALLLLPGVAQALAPLAVPPAGDRFMGRWRLDKAKSTIAHDPGVKSKEIVFAPAPGGGGLITETLEMASGPPGKHVTHMNFVYGRCVKQAEPGMDAFCVEAAGPDRVFWTAQKGGEPLARLQLDLSPGGDQLTFRYLASAADPTGKVTADRYVYDRQ